jgi:hypothetical protein
MNKNIIIWQKWIDPFGEDDLLSDNSDSKFWDDNENDDENDDDNEDTKYEENDKPTNLEQTKKQIKVIATPMGIIPINENTASGKIFNFWMGHTNFNITNAIVTTIENTDGVESLDVFTRYRFRIAIGKAFDDSFVMRNINDNVYGLLE